MTEREREVFSSVKLRDPTGTLEIRHTLPARDTVYELIDGELVDRTPHYGPLHSPAEDERRAWRCYQCGERMWAPKGTRPRCACGSSTELVLFGPEEPTRQQPDDDRGNAFRGVCYLIVLSFALLFTLVLGAWGLVFG